MSRPIISQLKKKKEDPSVFASICSNFKNRKKPNSMSICPKTGLPDFLFEATVNPPINQKELWAGTTLPRDHCGLPDRHSRPSRGAHLHPGLPFPEQASFPWPCGCTPLGPGCPYPPPSPATRPQQPPWAAALSLSPHCALGEVALFPTLSQRFPPIFPIRF